MRDAFGGSFMIKLFLVFIIVYVGFTAVALNYAKAFKVKNIVVAYLEDNEISDLNMTAAAENEMRKYFEKEIVGGLNYTQASKIGTCPMNAKCFDDIGVVIQKIEPNNSQRNKLGVYYKVTTYFGWNISFFKNLTRLGGGTTDNSSTFGRWTISGETRTIAYE